MTAEADRYAELAKQLSRCGEHWTPADVAAFERLAGKPVEDVEDLSGYRCRGP